MMGAPGPGPFVVVDHPREVGDWGSVAACFVSGRTWQFTGWFPKEGEGGELSVAEILSRVLGFHLCFEEEKVEAAVTMWNVAIMRIPRDSPTTQHKTLLVARRVWERIFDFLKKRR